MDLARDLGRELDGWEAPGEVSDAEDEGATAEAEDEVGTHHLAPWLPSTPPKLSLC